MPSVIAELARRLGENAETVCRHYLSNGQRVGNYWLVGDARNAPGRSLYVRLGGAAASRGRAGKWVDAATGEFGDLFDIIRESCGLTATADVADEARRFQNLPRPTPPIDRDQAPHVHRAGSPQSARLLICTQI